MPRRCSAHCSFSSDPTSATVATGTCATFKVACSICNVDGLGLMLAWTSSSLLEHFDGATQVRTPVSTMAFVKSKSWWLGESSPTILSPANLFDCISNLDCFSAAGSLLLRLVGSELSDFTCSLMLATMRVVASKCNFLRRASWPMVGVP